MSLPKATCRKCGQKNIEISAGPTGKPLIDCPKCKSTNVLEENQTELTTYFPGNEKLNRVKKARLAVESITDLELGKIVSQERKCYEELETALVETKPIPKKLSISQMMKERGAIIHSTPISIPSKKARRKSNRSKVEEEEEPKTETKLISTKPFQLLVQPQCWSCNILFNCRIIFENNFLTHSFFCPKCGVPQTFNCECGLLNPLHFDFCVRCARQPILADFEHIEEVSRYLQQKNQPIQDIVQEIEGMDDNLQTSLE
jgi:phage FluMu protein Com